MRAPRASTVGRALLVVQVVALACASPRAPEAANMNAARAATVTSALAVDSALTQLASRPLWPRFEPLRFPVAIFDGTRTYLFRHPAPPTGYVAAEGRPDVMLRDGRDPAVTANSSAPIGGVATATVMLDPTTSAADAAALTIHELFHAFQPSRHPSWQANEAVLFTYPVDDVAALALRREETFVLRRAIDAPDPESARCWVRAFVNARERRFAAIGAAAAAYEHGTELNEGLAQYVERRAEGRRAVPSATDAPAAQVRQRAYEVGAGQGTLLDAVLPGWREQLEEASAPATPLDALVAQSIVDGLTRTSCVPGPDARARWTAQAEQDVRAVRAERSRVRAEYLARPGWRLVVDADDAPLFPKGFDPLNVARLSDTEILHTRFLELQGTRGSVELLGGSALTEGAAGAHPLFAGVRRLTITGVAGPAAVRDSGGVLVVNGAGFSVWMRGARADTLGQTIRLTRR